MQDLNSFSTPMMQQYAEIKAQYPDAILFFRLGDFYEMFLDDAKIGAKVLGITLTSRHKGKDGEIPMCGVPFHAAEGYIQKFVHSGYKVAVCEQITKPSAGAEIVERDVIRVVTPSTVLDDSGDQRGGDLLMTFHVHKKFLGISLLSVQSGMVLVAQNKLADSGSENLLRNLREVIMRFQPVEAILNRELFNDLAVRSEFSRLGVSPFADDSEVDTPNQALGVIKDQYKVTSLEGFDIHDKESAQIALANGINYLKRTQKNGLSFLKNPMLISEEKHLALNGQTLRNLEIFSSKRRGSRDESLFGVLNTTQTPAGERMLANWLVQPLVDKDAINARYDVVSWFIGDDSESDQGRIEQITGLLEQVGDVERSIGRLALAVGGPRDLVAISSVLGISEQVRGLLENAPSLLSGMVEQVNWQDLSAVHELLSRAIADDPPINMHEGGYIKKGFSERLDQLRDVARGGKGLLSEIEERERNTTGISSLKIGFNKVFGYYIEVSKSNIDRVPAHYVRKQTLTNAERYIIDELKKHEDTVLTAQEEALRLETELFAEVVAKTLDKTRALQQYTTLLATTDVLQSFAASAMQQSYVRPEISSNGDGELEIVQGRHPVVEQISFSSFIPNDTNLSSANTQMMVLTGANMAGKSTFIRQVALLVVMAQIGSFVPAESMRFELVDRVHTRIGSADDLTAGLSTFMVEMLETAQIVNNLSDNSLVVLDEVGRGTSTYDGVSIAWAVSEYIMQNSRAKVMFATHYHELTELPRFYKQARNFHLAVSDERSKLVFLYRVKEGKASQSYGIEVAKRAGLPPKITARASEILHDLHVQANAINPVRGDQLGLFGQATDN